MAIPKEAMIDPALVYRRPEDIARDEQLSRWEKIELLERWKYDAMEDQIADSENMMAANDSGALYDRIVYELARLRSRP